MARAISFQFFGSELDQPEPIRINLIFRY